MMRVLTRKTFQYLIVFGAVIATGCDNGGKGGVDNTVIGLSSFVRGASEKSCNYLEVKSNFTRIMPYLNQINLAVENCNLDNTCWE